MTDTTNPDALRDAARKDIRTLAQDVVDAWAKRAAECPPHVNAAMNNLSAWLAMPDHEPVAWRHSHTLCLYETEEEVELADGDSWAEPLYLSPPAASARGDQPVQEKALRDALEEIANWRLHMYGNDDFFAIKGLACKVLAAHPAPSEPAQPAAPAIAPMRFVRVWLDSDPLGDSWEGIDKDGDHWSISREEYDDALAAGADVGNPEKRQHLAPVVRATPIEDLKPLLDVVYKALRDNDCLGGVVAMEKVLVWCQSVAAPAGQAQAVPPDESDNGISREQWFKLAACVYLGAGDDEKTAQECATYLVDQQDWLGEEIDDPAEAALEDIKGRIHEPASGDEPALSDEQIYHDMIACSIPVAAEKAYRDRNGQPLTAMEKQQYDRQMNFARAVIAADRAARQAPAEPASRVFLVATGEVHEGQETYTRHDERPPLSDAETLYAAPPAPVQQDWSHPVGLTPLQIADCVTGIKPYPLELVCLPREQVLAFAQAIEVAIAAKTDAATPAASEERAALELAREALRKIVAIEDQYSGTDWQEIEEAREIARAALDRLPKGEA